MATESNPQTKPQKGMEPDVLTPRKTPSWRFGVTITLLFLVVPLLLLLGFYFNILEL